MCASQPCICHHLAVSLWANHISHCSFSLRLLLLKDGGGEETLSQAALVGCQVEPTLLGPRAAGAGGSSWDPQSRGSTFWRRGSANLIPSHVPGPEAGVLGLFSWSASPGLRQGWGGGD